MAQKYTDYTGLALVVEKIKGLLGNKVDKVDGKGLSTNDYTANEKAKLANIEAGAQKNVNADWNATTGDAAILNKPDIPSVDDVMSSTSTNPVQNKVVNSAIENKVDKVRGKGLSENDFTDTLKDKLDGIADGATANVGTITEITMNGSSKGTNGNVDLGTVLTEHQDISGKADIASPTFTGTPQAPTATAGTSNTQIATTAFVMDALATAETGAATYQGTAPTDFAPTNYRSGYYWVVSTAGTYVGETCEPGDMIFAKNSSSTYQASDFNVVQTNLDLTPITSSEIDALFA